MKKTDAELQAMGLETARLFLEQKREYWRTMAKAHRAYGRGMSFTKAMLEVCKCEERLARLDDIE